MQGGFTASFPQAQKIVQVCLEHKRLEVGPEYKLTLLCLIARQAFSIIFHFVCLDILCITAALIRYL